MRRGRGLRGTDGRGERQTQHGSAQRRAGPHSHRPCCAKRGGQRHSASSCSSPSRETRPAVETRESTRDGTTTAQQRCDSGHVNVEDFRSGLGRALPPDVRRQRCLAAGLPRALARGPASSPLRPSLLHGCSAVRVPARGLVHARDVRAAQARKAGFLTTHCALSRSARSHAPAVRAALAAHTPRVGLYDSCSFSSRGIGATPPRPNLAPLPRRRRAEAL